MQVTVEDWGHRNQSDGGVLSEMKDRCHNGQTRMYEAGLHTLFPGKWQRGPSENSYAVYCLIIYLRCIWTTRTASILLNILYFIFYDSECLTVNKLEIKWSFQNTINISEIFPARDSSSLEWWQRQFVNNLFHLNLSGKHFIVLCLRGSQSNSSQFWLANRLSQEHLVNFSVTEEQQPPFSKLM